MNFHHDLVTLPDLASETTSGGRYYTTPTGERYPSVTTILGRQADKIAILDKWRARVGEEKAKMIGVQAARRGQGLHGALEKYVLHGDPADDLLPLQKMLFRSIRGALDKHLTIVRGVETPLYSHMMRLAGRTDMVGEWDGVNSIIDFKTSLRLKKEEWVKDYFLQTTAYSIMFEERTGISIPQIVVLIANDEDTYPQVFVKRSIDYVAPLAKVLREYNPKS